MRATAIVMACLCLWLAGAPAHADDEARQLDEQARARLEAGQYAEAADLATRALAIQERTLGPTHPDTAASLHDLAEAYRGLGNLSKALPLAKRSLEIRESALGRRNLATAESLNDLGLLYFQLGDCRPDGACREAEPMIGEALDIRRSQLPADSPLIAESLNNLGVIYRSRKRYAEALPLFEEALVIKQKSFGADDPRVVSGHTNLAALYLQWADETSAAGEIDRLRGEASDHLQTAKAALDRRSKAKDVTPAERILMATNAINLANFYWRLGPVAQPQARQLLEQALRLREETLGPQHPDAIDTRNLLAAFARSTGAYPQALTLYREGLGAENVVLVNVLDGAATDEQKLQFVRRSERNYWVALSLIADHFAHDEAAVRFGFELVLFRKGSVIDAQSRANEALARSLNAESRQVWDGLVHDRADLSRLLLSGPGAMSRVTWQTEIHRLQNAVSAAQERLAASSAVMASELKQRRATVTELARRLPADGALVEFVHIQDWDEDRAAWQKDSFRYLAFVLTPDDHVRLIDLGNAAAIDAAVTETRKTINDGALFNRDLTAYITTTDDHLADLYRRVVLPLEPAIGSRTHLIISPDGELNRVPFDALRTADGHYLVERRVLAYVTSGRDLIPAATGSTPTLNLLLVANPAFDAKGAVRAGGDGTRALHPTFRQNFGPLPGTKEEADLIEPLVTGENRVLLGDDATESRVTGTAAPRILHLATHGFFLDKATLATLMSPAPARASGAADGADEANRVDNPMVFSGLALAGANYSSSVTDGPDGILTALEVSGMNLHGTDLVVLSACETALGEVEEGEGVYGLRRAFALAGTHNLIMSLWPVSDEITRDLMVRFYRAYTAGASAPQALHQAQLETLTALREKYQMAPVNLWAPFIAQGKL